MRALFALPDAATPISHGTAAARREAQRPLERASLIAAAAAGASVGEEAAEAARLQEWLGRLGAIRSLLSENAALQLECGVVLPSPDAPAVAAAAAASPLRGPAAAPALARTPKEHAAAWVRVLFEVRNDVAHQDSPSSL